METYFPFAAEAPAEVPAPVIETIPVISLWRPWAQWVMLGWKPIETRTHDRFAGLAGQVIGIHAAQKWDDNWVSAEPYLSREQILQTRCWFPGSEEVGALLGTVKVREVRWLRPFDCVGSLIECRTKRFGLFLEDPKRLVAPVTMRGQQGIWRAPRP